jgi:hypothetical protein
VIAVSTSDSKPASSDDSTDRDPETTINVCLHRDTHTRLTAYKNYNPLNHKTFDTAVNEILDEIDFPEADEIGSMFLPSMTEDRSTDSEDDCSNDSDLAERPN